MCRINFWRKKERKKERRRIIITRFDCFWMQTQKSPNNPHIRIQACGCKFHHYQPISHFKILLDIDFHWNRRPLTICRFCWWPFWKRWHRKNDPECNFHHYQSIPHFKLTLYINFHWNQRTLKFCQFCRRPIWKWQQWTIKIWFPFFSIFSLVAILVDSRDHRTQFWKGTIQESFQQSLVEIGSVVSEVNIFF
jgi:hypothetical protein